MKYITDDIIEDLESLVAPLIGEGRVIEYGVVDIPNPPLVTVEQLSATTYGMDSSAEEKFTAIDIEINCYATRPLTVPNDSYYAPTTETSGYSAPNQYTDRKRNYKITAELCRSINDICDKYMIAKGFVRRSCNSMPVVGGNKHRIISLYHGIVDTDNKIHQ